MILIIKGIFTMFLSSLISADNYADLRRNVRMRDGMILPKSAFNFAQTCLAGQAGHRELF
jgi:hypothetical protein